MSVIIKIEGREAIPVRAIPLLTYWKTVRPDALAQALAGDEHFYPFEGMKAHRVNGGAVIRQTYWESLARELRALSDTIRTTEINHETGLQQYRIESLKKLPPSVYLWLDEFATAHARHYRLNNIVHSINEDVEEIELTEEQAHRLTEKRLDCVTLDLDPMADASLLALAMEGFELTKSLPVASVEAVEAVEAVPVESAGVLTPPNKIIHSTRTRRNDLTPVIEQAQKQCIDPHDTAAVWAALLVLAEKKVAPLLGATEDGLQYLKDGTAEIFTRKSLGKRLTRQAPLRPAKTR